MTLTPISFIKLAPMSLLKAAEDEIQAQLEQTDGELFHYRQQTFRGYNLAWPRSDVQALLQYFSDSGCVYSQYRLAYSLLPENLEDWPLKSEELSYQYALNAAEMRLNLDYDGRVRTAFREFEYSNEFMRYRFMMNGFIDRYALSRSISTDIISHFKALPTQGGTGRSLFGGKFLHS